MPNVLIRDVEPADLEEIRAEAAARGMSLQAFLREALHAQAAHLRRRAAVARVAARLRGTPAVPEEERLAVRDAIDAANDERGEQLLDRSDS